MENNVEKRKGAGRPKGATSPKSDRLKKKNKEILLESLRVNLGVISPALKAASVCRETFNTYYRDDLDFQREVDEIREDAIDFVEKQLFTQIKNGGAAQTIFYLKTKGRSRGYIEQTNTNMTIDAVRIKYVIPEGEEREKDVLNLPLNNKYISLDLPE